MALTLIKEDGTGKPDANAYASAADGDAYHDGHLYADAWQSADDERKEAALVMATRVIDAEYQFNGFKSNDGQALQWPRLNCLDPDSSGFIWRLDWWRVRPGDAFLASDAVPKAIVDATCEMARELLVVDRTAAPPGEGINTTQNTDLSKTIFSKGDTRPIISHVTQAMLAKYGSIFESKSGVARLVRS